MLCRLCVDECSNLNYIFKHDEFENDISSLISSYFTFQVSQNDKHSTKVCQCCLNKLRDFKAFCNFVENAQEKWKTIQQDIKPNENYNSSEVLEFEIEPYSDPDVADAEEEAEAELKIETIETYLNENDTNNPLKYEEDDRTKCIKNESVSPNNESDKKWVKSRVGQFDSLIAANSNLLCHECKKPMESFKELKKHFKIIHDKTGFMICCKRKFFRAADLADHINLHLNPDYFKCQQCDKCFSSRYSLDFHQKTCHVEEEGKIFFKCKHCSRKYLSLCARDNHEKVHDSNETEDEKHECLKCGKSYPNKAKLKAHDFNVHKMVYSRMCHLCGKAVRGNKALERHQLLHSGIKPKVQCNICGAELSTKGILKAHMIALHPEDSNVTYECNICGKKSPSERALKNHMDYVHKCERSHKCTFCDKSFKKIQALKEHLTTHTGDRLYKCAHCPKTFKVRSNMHHHRKLKHPKEFEENRGNRKKER